MPNPGRLAQKNLGSQGADFPELDQWQRKKA